MASKPITLNGKTWPTQTAAIEHFRQMLARYGDGEAIEVAADHYDLLALLQRYDELVTGGPSKIGAGVRIFLRKRNHHPGGFSTSGFWVRRVDGSETDFSFIQAVKGQPRQLNQEFNEACRMAVADDLATAKRQFFTTYADESDRVPCEITGRLIEFGEAHIDHADPTFRQLVLMFRATRGWRENIPAGVLTPPADCQTETRFANEETASAFREFHKVALLRVVAADVNIAMAAQQQRPRVARPVVLP